MKTALRGFGAARERWQLAITMMTALPESGAANEDYLVQQRTGLSRPKAKANDQWSKQTKIVLPEFGDASEKSRKRRSGKKDAHQGSGAARKTR